MSWVCDICSCNNDDESMECFVCGTHRSAESIRHGKIRMREKRREAFQEQLCNKTTFASKLLMIVVGVIFIIGCIIKIVQKTILVDFEDNFLALITTAKENILDYDPKSFGIYFISNIKSNGIYIGRCFSELNIFALKDCIIPVMISQSGSNIRDFGAKMVFLLPDHNKLAPAFPLINNLLENITQLGLNINIGIKHGLHNGALSGDRLVAAYHKILNNFAVLLSLTQQMLSNVLKNAETGSQYVKRIAAKHTK